MNGKTVVITGATSGIGEVAADRLAAKGARIVFIARDQKRGEETLKATVVKVDHDTRMITLRGADGDEATIEAGPEVKNLDQLKAGDLVTAHFQRALALELLPAGSASTGACDVGVFSVCTCITGAT